MPKAEKGSAKDIANKMKAKGLQKLKFFCQMCNKQCRDENGFKCHLTSASHLRNMSSFCSNASGMLDSFSSEFESNYLETLYRRHRTKRMNANAVYQEVIQDKDHVHMNATKWATLTDFVQYIGKMGKCKVEETERGWYVTYIERDPTILAQQENYKKRVEAEKREEKKVAKRMEVMRVEAARMLDKAGFGVTVKASKMERTEEDAPIALTFGGGSGSGSSGKKKSSSKKTKSVFGDDDDDDDDDKVDENEDGKINDKKENDDKHMLTYKQNQNRKRHHDEISTSNKRSSNELSSQSQTQSKSKSKSRTDQHENNDTNQKENQNKEKQRIIRDKYDLEDIRKKHWIRKNILAKIISKKIKKGKYYKRKCIVLNVHKYDKYKARVDILDSGPNMDDGGDIIEEIDQDELETVIPKVGKDVMILNGRGRGMVATLISVDETKCRASLQLLDYDHIILKKVNYDDFSKVC